MRKTFALLLALAVLFPSAGYAAGAEGTMTPETGAKDKSNTCLCTAWIRDPDPPADRNAAWSGCYVYFGAYDGSPIRFRVLAKDSTAYTSGKALFLDSDRSLFDGIFDDTEPYFNSWDGSGIRRFLNGPFLDGFDACEKAAIAVSVGNGGTRRMSEGMKWGPPVSVDDRVFLLDLAETRNEAYGYSPEDGSYWSDEKSMTFYRPVRNRIKSGSPRTGCWMLRTASSENSENRGWHVLSVGPDGDFLTKNAADAGVYSGSGGIGIAPALNVDQNNILFSSLTGAGADEFKLTLIDSGLSITVPDGKTAAAEGNRVNIPYAIGGPDAGEGTRASVLILDREYAPGNENSADIIFYGALGGPKDDCGTFVLPDGCEPGGWGTDYYVYILAEVVNGPYETDRACAPVLLNAPGSLPAMGEARVIPGNGTVAEVPEKNEGNTCLGTSGIPGPVPGGGDSGLWRGSYVYFGTYNGRPIRFRVLAKDSTAYTTGKALFLDSDEALFVDRFDDTAPYSNSWEDSDIRKILNGVFLEGFDTPERDAIAHGVGTGGRSYASGSPEAPVYGTPVSVNDRVFLLDAADVTNEAYGYSSDPGWKYIYLPKEGDPGRIKCGAFTYWWLRSASADDDRCVGDVNCAGILNVIEVNYYMGVAPAMNVCQENILFSTLTGTEGNEFKLTVIDRDLSIAVPEDGKVLLQGSMVTVPYVIGGPDVGVATRASVLILDREYTQGNENGANIICYRSLGSASDAYGTFEIPAGCGPGGWGTDYHVYILAENINGMYETDHASVPVPLGAPESP